jgi:hypothetical protein
MTGDSDFVGETVQFDWREAAFGCAGNSVGPGWISVLPYVGNRDPNPRDPKTGAIARSYSQTLIAALSVRDPMPIGP